MLRELRWYFVSLVVIITSCFSASLSATDLNGDGLSELHLFDATQSKALAVDTSFTVVAETLIDPSRINGDPILIPAEQEGQYLVYSLRFRKKDAGLFAFRNNQQVGEIRLGKFRNGSVFAYQFNANDTTDLLIVNGKQISVLFDPFTTQSLEQRLPIRLKRKGVAYPFWRDGQAYLAISNPSSRRNKRRKRKPRSSTTAFSLNSLRSEAITIRSVRLSQAPIPLVAADGSILTVKSPKRFGASKRFELINILTGERQRFATEGESELIPGTFVSGSSANQLLVTNSGIGQIFDFANTDGSPLLTLDLFPGSGGPPGTPDDDQGFFPPPDGECVDEYPNELLAQIEIAYNMGDFATLAALTTIISQTNFCPDIMSAVLEALSQMFSPRQLELAEYGPRTTFIRAPFYSTRDPNRLPGGCDSLQDGQDGPGGFLWKPISEKGSGVALTPIFASKASLIDCRRGKTITSLNNTGPSNGRAATLRAPSPGPAYGSCAIVKVTQSSFFGGEGAVSCWKINPSIRND